MTGGKIIVHGSCGVMCGAEMQGGTIHVHGSAGHSAGCQMLGGELIIHNDAGDNAGGVFPGTKRGQRGGVILIRRERRCNNRTVSTARHFDRARKFWRRDRLLSTCRNDHRRRHQRNFEPVTQCDAEQFASCSNQLKTNTKTTDDSPTMLAAGHFVAGYRGRPIVLRLLEQTFKQTVDRVGITLDKKRFDHAWHQGFHALSRRSAGTWPWRSFGSDSPVFKA